MTLGTAPVPRLDALRWAMLGIAGLGLPWAILARPALRRIAAGLLACIAGFLVLGLVFGDQFWVHHFSSMPIWFVAAFGTTMELTWRVPRIGPGLVVLLAAGLVASNLLSWRVVQRGLEITGGRNLCSDAIVHFAESVARDPRRPAVATPD